MNKSKKLVFSFFITAALINSRYFTYNYVHAAEAIPNIQSSAYNGDINIFTKYGYKGQCTWFTYGRAIEKLGISLPSEFYGNAVDWWYANARDHVYNYGSEPRANSIAVWAGGNYGYGHVGFVEKVKGTTVYLTEGNFNISHNYDGVVKALSTNAIKNRGNLYLKGYIYISDTPLPNDSKPKTDNTKSLPETVINHGTVNLSSSNSALNIRNGASTSFNVIGYLKNGQAVDIVGVYGDWYKIQYNNSYGYVSSKFISLKQITNTTKQTNNTSALSSNNTNNSLSEYTVSEASKASDKKIGTVTLNDKASSLCLRNSPWVGRVISNLPYGSRVEILDNNGRWYKVKVGSAIGYVHSDYIKL